MFLPASTKIRNLQLAVLVFVVVAVFWNVVDGGLLAWDDRQLLLEDPNLRSLTAESFLGIWTRVHNMLYIPLVQSFWFLNGLAFGQWDSSALHAMNLVFHAVNALLVFALLRKLIPRDQDLSGWIAFTATAFFALHPTKVEGVAWVAGFKEIIAATFGLGSLLLYLQYRDRGSRFAWCASIAAFGFSLVAKPAFVTLPLCFLVLEIRSKRDVKPALVSASPYFLVSLAITIVTTTSQEPHGLLFVPSFLGRCLVALDSLGFYLVKLVTPWTVAPDYGRMSGFVFESPEQLWWTLPPLAAVIIAIAGSRNRDYARAFLLFVLSIAPVLGLQPFFFQQISTVADRYLYFPSLWISLLLGLALGRLAIRPRAMKTAVGAVGVFILVCAFFSVRAIPKWSDDKTFFTWMLERNPRSFNAVNRLADIEREAGRFENALKLYQASRQIASWQPYPWLYSAFVMWEMGRRDEAFKILEELVAKYPTYYPAQENLRMLRERSSP